MSDIEVLDPICGCVEFKCFCRLPPMHGGPHACECGGSWTYEDGQMKPITYPGGASDPITAVYDRLERGLWL